MYLRTSQVIILIAAVACNLAFVPVLQKWVRFHEWGVYAFIIPNEPIDFFHLEFMATDIVSVHVALSFFCLRCCFSRWCGCLSEKKAEKYIR